MSRISDKIDAAISIFTPTAGEIERLKRGNGYWYYNQYGNWVWVLD